MANQKQNIRMKFWVTAEKQSIDEKIAPPATKRLRAKMDEPTARRTALQSECRKAQQKEREYDTLSQNVSMLLEQPKYIVLPKGKTNELE